MGRSKKANSKVSDKPKRVVTDAQKELNGYRKLLRNFLEEYINDPMVKNKIIHMMMKDVKDDVTSIQKLVDHYGTMNQYINEKVFELYSNRLYDKVDTLLERYGIFNNQKMQDLILQNAPPGFPFER